MSDLERITAGHVSDLVDSYALDAALVRYDDGSLEVRSTSPFRPGPADYKVVIRQDALSEIDQSGMDFDNLTWDDLEALAEALNMGEEHEMEDM